MKHGLYGVFDRKAESVLNGVLMLFATPAASLRFFGEILVDPKSDISRYPDDYDLVRFGDYDFSNSSIIPVPNPVELSVVAYGSDVIERLRREAAQEKQEEMQLVPDLPPNA